jgi:NAD(P)-dependent dehydrogenase (short-subunit alcohol dehydrogenase family)
MYQNYLDKFLLKDKVIVVTGGTGVLGKTFVNAVADAGATVVILGRNETKANERVAEIMSRNGKAIFLKCDVLDEASVNEVAEKVMATYGKIDGLVNAAGGNVPESVIAPTADVFSFTVEGMKKAMDLNLWGTLIPTQIFGKHIAKSGGGSIVNISSVSAKRALTRVLGYSMGKAAIDCFTKWFAVELANRYGDKVRMNSIMPGFFLTEQNRTLLTNEDGNLTDRGNTIIKQTPFKRFGNADELGGALIFLLSDASSFVTGTDISVDGGFTAFSGV